MGHLSRLDTCAVFGNMHNCLILGSGRSGTSLIAGVLAQAGYFMGADLYPPRHSNPKGFYEDVEINGINEALLSRVLRRRPPVLGRWFFRDRPRRGQFWLARLPVDARIRTDQKSTDRIQALTAREPYCFKDPRFSYTLPAWRPYLRNAVCICVFRAPAVTAASILKECQSMAYLRDLSISFQGALDVWRLMYSHILEIHSRQGLWLFLHYNQVMDGAGLDRLEAVTGAKADRSFPDRSLGRSKSSATVPDSLTVLYKRLCDLAEYDDFPGV